MTTKIAVGIFFGSSLSSERTSCIAPADPAIAMMSRATVDSSVRPPTFPTISMSTYALPHCLHMANRICNGNASRFTFHEPFIFGPQLN
jgi:hypothetical protein